ncbi:4-hydroxybenzoate transporter [Klebsiella pneumoniae]|uniref:4-hydroxybenzoate transporter n=1 Tax=Klebsiella pneumoniae TaxID=573 RepID=A0A2X3FQL5_KLEPN|nr:4-hydroxybenzoate transporter [Klebsiella pneumoniae]
MNHTNVVDVKAWIDTRPVSRFQWNVLLLCFIIIMLDGYDAAVMGFVAPALIEDWGISRAEMGPILGAAMFGVAIGALVAGPLSDRYGRKRILLWSVALFALFSLAGAVAQSPTQLALMRFLTGLGLGAVMPNCVTLVAEYMPERRKGVMITLMYSGFNVGSGLGGFIAAGLLSHYSWHSALVFGGVLPLVVLPFMIVMLPESAMNMVARRLPGEQIARALNRLGGQFTAETVFQLNAPPITRSSKVAQLFRHGYARGTIALWLTYFYGAVRDLPAERLAANHSPLRRAVAAAGGDDDRLVPARRPAGRDPCRYADGSRFGESRDCGNLFPRLFVPVVPGGDGFRFGGAVGADFYQRDVH